MKYKLLQEMKDKLFDWYEKKRIKLHLLKARSKIPDDHPDIPKERNKIRQERLGDLETYTLREQYPINSGATGKAPYIMDGNGTLCAMAYLIEQSGDHALVKDLDKEGRNYYIPEFQSPGLKPWLNRNGITAEEATIIQPEYGYYTGVAQVTLYAQLVWILTLTAIYKLNSNTLFSSYKLDKRVRYSYMMMFGIISYLMMILIPLGDIEYVKYGFTHSQELWLGSAGLLFNLFGNYPLILIGLMMYLYFIGTGQIHRFFLLSYTMIYVLLIPVLLFIIKDVAFYPNIGFYAYFVNLLILLGLLWTSIRSSLNTSETEDIISNKIKIIGFLYVIYFIFSIYFFLT